MGVDFLTRTTHDLCRDAVHPLLQDLTNPASNHNPTLETPEVIQLKSMESKLGDTS